MTDIPTTPTVVPPIGNLAVALAKFQADMPSVPKNKTAKVQTKSGGEYTYKYADLADVTAAAMPLLAKHELAFICAPEDTPSGFMLRGTLVHKSGESVTGVLPLHGQSNQELGSSLTYQRRYLLGALTGIVTDDDEDGAVGNEAPRAKAQPRQKPVEPPALHQEADPAWADKIAEAQTYDELTVVYNEADRLGVLGHMLGSDTVKSALFARRGVLTEAGAQ